MGLPVEVTIRQIQCKGVPMVVYGMQLPVQSQSTLYAEPWEAGAGPADLLAVARAADAHGFDYLASCDHVAIPRRLAGPMSTVWYDPVATLSFLAAATERVRLLAHVAVVGLRHPLVTAKAYATLDHLSGGRLVLGVGAGHVQEEFEALGVDFARRGAVLDETLDALRAALGPEEYPEHLGSGSPSRTWGSCPGPRRSGSRSGWAAPPRPPCAGPPSGDGWLPQGDPRDRLAAQIQKLLRLRAEAGIAEPVTVGAITEALYVGAPGWEVGRRTLSGRPEELAASLRAYGEMGVHQIQVRFRSRSRTELIDQMAAFGAEVAPHL
ncbi:TIGR03619 family F420-dependent LLM class oxidoreductase [Streptomyces diastatochromogenes]|nr:TIGR03619 family F420-dependent LLM class oxidoreductase [Streptomyces diastatochromogenes]